MPEDTGVLSAGVLTPAEFLEQAHIAMAELRHQLPWFLEQFDRGLLFYYVGNGDLISHMMWRSMDPGHPAYDAERDAPYADVIPRVYEEMDALVSYTLDHMGDDTLLIVMSDHGFTSWRRVFHLNAWLHQNGYLKVKDESLPEIDGLRNVDWSGTRAYGIGLNGLYINVEGRERDGIVPPEEREALLDEIAAKLEAEIDPWTGEPAVARVFVRDRTFTEGGQRELGPDAVMGYVKGTGGGNESALGVVGPDILTDNEEPWSGDHRMVAEAVPGILATSRPLKRPARDLKELHDSVLAEFGVERDRPAGPEN
jgi:predicted AlkP superfamily phosphohydrolase/phosphomutase